MSKLRIKNFGPITEGLENNEFLDISKLTVFIGNQGTGKSTVAKLFSTFAWMEKNLFKKNVSSLAVFSKNYFHKRLQFHKIDSYLKKDTEIEYKGDYLTILYKAGGLISEGINKKSYVMPKIQYIPAERNLLSIVDKYAQISYLPESLQDFMFVYDLAVQSDCVQNLELPINNLKIRYNKRKHKVELYNNDYEILLSEASSGLQSFVPYYVVQKFLIDEVFFEKKNFSFKNLEERRKVFDIFQRQNGDTPVSDDELIEFALKNSELIFNSCLISILEEPEQNLFPISQKNMIFDLLSNLSFSENNKLLLTTHSPYLLPYINSAVKASELIKKNPEKRNEIEKLIPSVSHLQSEDVHVYELSDGKITELKKVKNIASDENLLNKELEETNEYYRSLLKAGM